MAFQYIMPTPVDMSDVFAPLMHARQANKDREAKRAELLLRKEAADRENARLDEQMRHTNELENRQKSLDTANAIPKIKNMLTPGHPDYDPESGLSLARAYGINLAAQQPEMPKPPEAIPDKPLSALPEGVDAVSGGTPPPEAAENTALDATRAAQQGEYTNKLMEASRRAPTYSGSGPFGAVNIDPNAAIASRNEALRQQQEKLAPLTGAVDQDFRPVVEAMVKSGMPGSEIAKAVADYRKEMATNNRDAQYKPTVGKQDEWHQMMYRAAMANAGARRAQAGDDDPAVGAAIARHLTENPGDIEGAYRVAQQAGSQAPTKTVGAVRTQVQPTESQAKDARQAAVGQRALEDISASGYTPSQGDIQMWLNNQKRVAWAQNAGSGQGLGSLIGGGIAGAAQGAGLIPQSETEGLDPKAANYFANVRRYMETIGRAQSGAAISPTEWQNFFNQYGPSSPGGGNAARRYMEDQAKLGGSATRQLEAPRRREEKPPARKSNPIIDARHRPSLDDLAAEHGL